MSIKVKSIDTNQAKDQLENIPESTQKHIDDLVKTINKLNKERNKLALTDVSDMLILTPKDAEVFFNEIMNPKDANEALKKAKLKFINANGCR